MKTEIELRQTNRFIILYHLYKEVKGRLDIQEDILGIAAKHDIKNGNYKEAYQYLADEGYIKLGEKSHHAALTHEGKKAVEHIVTNPEKRTENFPPFNEMGI